MPHELRCASCGQAASVTAHACACGGRLMADASIGALKGWAPSGTGLQRYLPVLPVDDLHAAMGEGGTPLVESGALGPALGIRLYFKMESLNPTGSYKDRIATIGAAIAAAHSRPAMVATSSGNAGAAIAAYAARAGLGAILVVPEEAPASKLAQIRAYGGVVVTVRGILSRADAVVAMFQAVVQSGQRHNWLPMITAHRYAPAAMEGIKTLSFEIVETLPGSPDRVYVPVGGGGLLVGTWRGFVQAAALGWTERVPKIIAVQPEGCSPMVLWYTGRTPTVDGPTTAVSGLQVADPPDGDLVLQALSASGGSAVAVSDHEIYAAQRKLARDEGIFAEPAGAAALAGVVADRSAGRIRSGESVVCLITGSGFKDPEPLHDPRPLPLLNVAELGRLGDVAVQALAGSRT